MSLFDSGGQAPGTSYAFIPPGSGNYPYADGQDTSGSVHVPVSVSPENGTVSTRYRVTWATDPPSGADAFQVQVRPPGATTFSNWIAASTDAFAVFDAGSPLWSGRGQYAFRVRCVQTTTGAASGYSGVRVIDVT
jgi:hypothetical protein